ncbi:unnamed protein product [Lota lota]
MPCLRPWWSLNVPSADPTEYLRDWTRTLGGAPVVEIPESQQRTYFPGALRHPWPGEPASPGFGPLSWSLDSIPPTAMFLSPYSSYPPAIVAQMESVMEYSSRFDLPPPPPFASYQVTMEMAPPRGATYNPLNREQVHNGDPSASQRASLQLLQCPPTLTMFDPQPDVSCSFTPSVINQLPLTSPAFSPLTSWCGTNQRTQSIPSSHYHGDRAGSNHWLAEEPDSDLSLVGPTFTTSSHLSLQPDVSQTSVESSRFLRDRSKVNKEYPAKTEWEQTAAQSESKGDESGVVEVAGWDTPRRRNRRYRPWHSTLDLENLADMGYQGYTEIVDPPFVPQSPEGSETLDGEARGDWFSEYEDEEEEPEEETWSPVFMEYLDELCRDRDFVSTVGSMLDVAYLESPEPTELIGSEHGETFQADIQQTPEEASSSDGGAILEPDTTGSLAEVVLDEGHHTEIPPPNAGRGPSCARESPSAVPALCHDGSDQSGSEDVWQSWPKSKEPPPAQPPRAPLGGPLVSERAPISPIDGEVEEPPPSDSSEDRGTDLKPFCSEVFSAGTVVETDMEDPSPGTKGTLEFCWEHFDDSITGAVDDSKCDDGVLKTMATLVNKHPFPSPPHLSTLRFLTPPVSPGSPSAVAPSPHAGVHASDPLINIPAEPKRREDPENETQREDEGGALNASELRSAPSEDGSLSVTHGELASWRDREQRDPAHSTASSKDRYSDVARGMTALHLDSGTDTILGKMSVNATKAFLEIDLQVDVTGLPPLYNTDNDEDVSVDREVVQPEDKDTLVGCGEDVHEAHSLSPDRLESRPASTDSTRPFEWCSGALPHTQQQPAISTLTSGQPVVHPENQAPQASCPSLGDQALPLDLDLNPTSLLSGPLTRARRRSRMFEGSIQLTKRKTHQLLIEKEEEMEIYNFSLLDLRAKTLATANSGLTPNQRLENSDTSKTEAREMAMTSEKAPRASPRLRNRSKTLSPLKTPRRRGTALGKEESGPREITALFDASGLHTPRPTRWLKRRPANENASAKESPVTSPPSPVRERRKCPTDDKRNDDENEKNMSSPRKRLKGLAVKENGDIVTFQQDPMRERRKCRMYDKRNEEDKEKTLSPMKRSRRGRSDGEEDRERARKPMPDRDKFGKQHGDGNQAWREARTSGGMPHTAVTEAEGGEGTARELNTDTEDGKRQGAAKVS